MRFFIGVFMEIWKNIKNLHMFHKKSFKVVLAVELILLALGIIGLFGKNATYDFGAESMTANFGTFDEKKQGYYVTASDGVSGNLVDFGNLGLKMGVYEVSLHYATDTDMKNICTVTDGLSGYRNLKTNGEHLYSGLQETDFVMWVLSADTSGLIVHAEYGGEGELLVKGLTVRETNALARMFLFWVIVVSTLVNAVLVYRTYDRVYGISIKEKTVIFGLFVIILISSIPLMLDYMLSAGDKGYHLMRIEGIRASIEQGMFPARNAPEWQQGYGYASAIFYGETLLYLAAAFRLLGFTVLTSYRLFYFCVTVAQVLITYFVFKEVFEEKYIGLLCSALYSFSVYRIYKTYACGSFGEGLAQLFLPLFVYGFWKVFTGDIHEKSYKNAWISLVLGFAGLIQTHLLSGEMVGLFTVVLCVIEIRKVFRKETFLVLAKTVVYTCLVSAWFLVPFLDYMLTGDFVIQHVSGRQIQHRGLYVAQLFFTYPETGGNSNFAEQGMYDSVPSELGAALVVALLLWVGMRYFCKLPNMKKEHIRLGWIATAFALCSMIMSLTIFPWDEIHGLGGIFETLVSSLQFLNRWLSISTIALVTLAGVLAKGIAENYGKNGFLAYAGVMALALAISNGYFLSDIAYDTSFERIYNAEGMGTGYISGGEYLPYGADASLFSYRDPLADDCVVISDYEKNGLSITLSASNDSSESASIQMPLLFYKGYVAYDSDGVSLDTYADSDFLVSVDIPAGFSGEITVSFQSPWYWRVAELVSLLSFVGMMIAGRRRK